MSARPSCRVCGRPVVRARGATGPVTLDVAPSPQGTWELDLDVIPPRARKWQGAAYSTAATPERLWQRHFETCPKVNRPSDGPGRDLGEEQLLEQRDALAAALDARTHEFVVDDYGGDLCAALTPHRCGLLRDHDKHHTSRLILAALAPRTAPPAAHTEETPA